MTLTHQHRDRLAMIAVALAFVGLLAFTGFATRRLRAHESALAHEWEERGAAALRDRRADAAVEAYRNALFYSRHATGNQLRLAQALLAAGRPHEARPYLAATWRADPARGIVNLELARLDAADGRREDAVRHFEGAIHGLWNAGDESTRQGARLELIRLLVGMGARERAVAEVMDWVGALREDDARGHDEAGRLLFGLDEGRLALGRFRQALAHDPGNAGIRARAGAAAAHAGDWRLARSDLRRVPAAQRDAAAERLLAVAEQVVTLDPWAPRLPLAERGRRTRRAVEAARQRVDACAAPAQSSLAALGRDLDATGPTLTDRALRRDPDGLDAAFGLVLRTEEAAARECGPPRPVDEALLWIAQNRQDADDDRPGS